MTIDEGYIKYVSDWTPGPAPDAAAAQLLERWRRPLYDAGLIGHYDDLGVGFGNISVRHGDGFIISATQTGHLARTDPGHYALVTGYDIERNTVSSTGPLQASSEALTHAAIYELDDRIGAVVHVHSEALWRELMNTVPTTSPEISYGTPEMAREFGRLYADTEFVTQGVAVMAGHDEGIVTIGASLGEASRRILDYL